MSGNQTKKVELQRFDNIIKTVGFESLSAIISEEFPKANVALTELHFGISLPTNEEIFKLCDWWDLPEGLICANCYSQVPLVTATNDYRKRVCDSCHKKYFQQVARAHDVSLAMVRYPPFTTNRVTHIAFVGRQSRGDALSEESFEILQKFSREWSGFPFRKTNIQNYIGNFGGHGSALALYSSMTGKLTKNSNGITFFPLSELIARQSCFFRQGLDHIAIVFYAFTSLSVKAKNLNHFGFQKC
ncbi:hypothetical protein OUZ56_028515 [Daphnia magna]|uniref:Uncharacterized protein n=1 Tax=Daphnia magna TaxID=35525 RepID=A0ABR0B468_9CRUS|nr:hypothetical protein OUZ56_028515 [Daphnia magna]